MNLSVQLRPDDDPELAAAARELVQALAGTDPVETRAPAVEAPERGVDWMALAGLVLAAPQTAVALRDLAARLSRGRGRAEIRQRIEPPLTRVHAAARVGQRQVTLIVGEVTMDLAEPRSTRCSMRWRLRASRRGAICRDRSG